MTDRSDPSSDWADIKVRRLGDGPIIRPEMLPADEGANINGPCLLRVPEWVASPLARYYLYFAHHGGKHIRLALADHLEGPWRIHPGGVLPLASLPVEAIHIASPEVLVDETARQIRLYFHLGGRSGQPIYSGPHAGAAWDGQTSHVALSADGLAFEARPEVLGPSYLRVFRHEGQVYGLAMCDGGLVLLRSADGLTTFERGPALVPRCRHCAVLRREERLLILFSRTGDAPERVLATHIDLHGPWTTWPQSASPVVEVLRAERVWEGAGHPPEASRSGDATGVNQLRDPHVYQEGDRTVLFYSVAGESGIAVAELSFHQA